jgi:hypothetical protein
MNHPTPTGLAALRVIPLTPDEIADLLVRAGESQRDARANSVDAALAAASHAAVTRKARVRAEAAARAVLAGRRVTSAAREYHCSTRSLLDAMVRVAPWWRRRPTRSRCAARLIQLTECSLAEAARAFGISREATRLGVARLRGAQ